MGSMNDDGLILEFVTESKEHLDSIEPDLLVLEKEGRAAGDSIINKVFRAIHSIKGAAGFFGLDALKNLSHVMESVLMMVRDGSLDPTPEVMDPLLVGVDKLNLMLGDVQNSESVPYQEEVQRLELLMGKKGELVSVSKKPAGSGTPEFSTTQNSYQVTQSTLEASSKGGQKLFSITLLSDEDLVAKGRTILDVHQQLLTIGLVLDSLVCLDDFAGLENCLNTSLKIRLLCATVLEADLLALSIDVADTKVELLTIDQVLEDGLPEAVDKAEAVQQAESAKQVPSKVPSPSLSKSSEQKNLPASSSSDGSHDSIRVRVDLLNRLMDLAGELVLSRNQLLRSVEEIELQNSGLESISQNIDLITSDLQEHIMQTRMQPVGSIFGKFPRIIRDMSKQLNKEIQLQTSGEEVELDKTILENLSDPLTHLIRNCCDHAIEMPDERVANGKPSVGTIQLKAFHEGGQINIAIIDNGKGIDHERVVKKVISQGVLSEADVKKMSTQEMVNLIFMPGLSTAEKVSDISGRGVGMDVVKTNIEKIGGTISIDTTPGKGTTILLRLPLTLAIIPSLVVGSCDNRFAVPQVNLVELVCVKAAEIATRIEKVGSASVLRLRGKLLPLIRLCDVLEQEKMFFHQPSGEYRPDRRVEIADPRIDPEGAPPVLANDIDNQRQHWSSDYNILVLKVGENNFGLIVDKLYDMEEIVVKPMSSFIKSCKTFAGATIMGDGRVAMILDAGGLLAAAKLSYSEIQAEEKRHDDEIEESKHLSLEQRAVVLFNNASDELFALPLASVLRLEKFKRSRIERLGSREFISYQSKSIELFRLESSLPVRSCCEMEEELFLILPKSHGGHVGIVASRIVDTLEMTEPLDTETIVQEGISGSAIINGHLTVFINPEELLQHQPIHQDVVGGLVAHAC